MQGLEPTMTEEGSGTASENQYIVIAWPHADRAGNNTAPVSTSQGGRQPEGQGKRRLQRVAAYTGRGASFDSEVVGPREGYPPCVLKPGPGVATKMAPNPPRENVRT